MRAPEPVVDEKVRFVSGDVFLEGVLTYPRDVEPVGAAVLLPPHPHFAGDLDNNVLRRLAPELAAAGCGVLRFNYRGVGGSEIDLPAGASAFDYWHRLELDQLYDPIVDDALAALDFLGEVLEQVPRIDLVGYSFGALLAVLTACRNPRVEHLVGVAPPLARYDFRIVRDSPAHKTFLLADDDFLYGETEIRRLADLLGSEDHLEILDDADHFFRGREAALARRVRELSIGLSEPGEVFQS